ncbi:ThiF family adenylyltransferase [Actinopolymorpha sp. B9G3]|uniref:ThiF family adenylyltransferase n=1 Tax=Actinopolymorpha sp. B9G3 TaxID=3158970 RepID=UPI0032D9514C
MRPRIKPALHRIWRDPHTLQVGLDPAHTLVLTGLDPVLAGVVDSLTGIRTEDALVTQAVAHGGSGADTRRLLRLLAEGGALDDAGRAAAGAVPGLGPAERERLLPDLAARSVAEGSIDGGVATMSRRREAHIAVFGAGRVGASIITLVSSSGVARVVVDDQAPTAPGDLAPAGLVAADVGTPRGEGAARAAARAAPSTEVMAVSPGHPLERPDLAVIAPDDEPDRRMADAFVRAGLPHLFVRMREGRAILGPFVLPGVSSCIRCHDLRRTAHDPRWPSVLSQALAAPRGAEACDVVLGTALASHAVMHVLAFLEGGRPPSLDATIEMDLPFGSVRRRTWSAHPACGCQFDPEQHASDESDGPRDAGKTPRSTGSSAHRRSGSSPMAAA